MKKDSKLTLWLVDRTDKKRTVVVVPAEDANDAHRRAGNDEGEPVAPSIFYPDVRKARPLTEAQARAWNSRGSLR